MTLTNAVTLVYDTFHTNDMSMDSIRDLIIIALIASGVDKIDAHILAMAYPHNY